MWLYGFMTGVRSCRKLEAACRDQIPYLWLTGWQHQTTTPCGDSTKTQAGYEEAVRADGSYGGDDETGGPGGAGGGWYKVGANASVYRTHDAEELRQLLNRVEAAIRDLEAQNEAGEDTATAHLPGELANKEMLRKQVRQAMADLERKERQKRINLTDGDARLMKTRGSVLLGYNAQAMVSPLEPDGGATGMFITAVDMADDSRDEKQLVPMIEQAEETTGTKSEMTLADAAYHSGRARKNAHAEASQLRCRRRDNSCLGTHITRTDLSMTSPATASCVHRDRGSSFYVSNVRTESRGVCTGPLEASAKRARPSESVRGPKSSAAVWR